MKNTINTNKSINPSLSTLLKEVCTIDEQVALGLIRNPIYDNHEVVKEIQQELKHYQDDASERGIEYAGCLSAQEEVSQDELDRVLDPSDLLSIKEQDTPALKRNNFWYVDKLRNNQDGYTRYLLANWDERIVTDDEMNSNPWFAYQRNLSDAYEDGDFDKYNKLKDDWKKSQSRKYEADDFSFGTLEQCFIKVWDKLYGDMFQMFTHKFYVEDDEIMNSPSHLLLETLSNKEHKVYDRTHIIKTLLKDNVAFRKIYENRIQTKIKIVNTNNKLLAVI